MMRVCVPILVKLRTFMNLFFRFRHKPKHLDDLLTFDGDHLEGGEKDSCENMCSNFKVGEQVAGTLPPTGDTKRTELKGTVAVGTKQSGSHL